MGNISSRMCQRPLHHATISDIGDICGVGTIVQYRTGEMNIQEQQYNSNMQNYQGYQSQISCGGGVNSYQPMTMVEKSFDGDRVLKETKKEDIHMMTEVIQDTKKFLKDHKSMIYWAAFLLLADHFLFSGAFKDRLQAIMSSLVGKVEEKLKGTQP